MTFLLPRNIARICAAARSVSVYQSVMIRHCIKTAYSIVEILQPQTAPMILVFCELNRVPRIQTNHPLTGTINTRGVPKIAIFEK